jgi:hypothetical protein
MGFRVISAAAFVAATALVTGAAPAAKACGNSMAIVVLDAAEVMRAEDLLLAGDAARAFEKAHDGIHHVVHGSRGDMGEWQGDGASHERDQLLRRRANRIMASAVIRLQGRVNLHRGRALHEVPARRAEKNLLWARQVLVTAFDGDKSPVNEARMAEALATSEAHWRQSLTRLRRMATEDLMPDAFGWAALARLERRDGQRVARTTALRECHARAGEQGRNICGKLPGGES